MCTGHGQAHLCTGTQACTCAHADTHSPQLSLSALSPALVTPGPPLPHTLQGPRAEAQPPGISPSRAARPHTPCSAEHGRAYLTPSAPGPWHTTPGSRKPGRAPFWLGTARHSSAQALPAKFAGERHCRGGTSRRRCQTQRDMGQAALGDQAQATHCHKNVAKLCFPDTAWHPSWPGGSSPGLKPELSLQGAEGTGSSWSCAHSMKI